MITRHAEGHAASVGESPEVAELHRLATLGMLSATVAHEVNNCLTPALSFIQLAMRARETGPVRDDLKRALSCIERAASISSAVLVQAREDADAPLSADVSNSLGQALDCLARKPEKDGVRVGVKIPADLYVAITPDALRQVFLNLILNAQRALKGRSGNITVHAGRSTWNNAAVRIVVEDDGPGVPASIANDLFKPFITAPATEGGERGSGLGLTVTRSLLESVGGSITLDRQHRGGARFLITLPVAKKDESAAA